MNNFSIITEITTIFTQFPQKTSVEFKSELNDLFVIEQVYVHRKLGDTNEVNSQPGEKISFLN